MCDLSPRKTHYHLTFNTIVYHQSAYETKISSYTAILQCVFNISGDVKGAGTDSNVYIILISESGIQSRAIHLDCKWRDDFEKGNIDSFKVGGISRLGSIGKIVLWRDTSVLYNDGWFVQWVKIKNLHALEDSIDCFPCNRWIKRDRRMIITKNDCVLPQFDDNQEQRALEILEKRRNYGLARRKPGIPKQVRRMFLQKITRCISKKNGQFSKSS